MKPYYTTRDWIELLKSLPPNAALLPGSSYRMLTGLSEKAARQACWRMTRQGLLTHIGAGWYTHAFSRLTIEEAAAVLVQPSYVSLESALRNAGATTQPSAALTCVTLQPTQTRRTPLGGIRYHSISRELYWGFDIRRSANGLYVFEAWPEKALLDLIYLSRRRGDRVWIDLDFSRLNAARLNESAARFPTWAARELNELRETRTLVS
ncbi:MAG: hypothetical protein FJW39_04990 [Acidobacteria bacterium]|nr:hypothetical protein [Acidobacteriota bacterium]